MKKVIYIGNFSFPDGNAAGKRVYGIGKILQESGYEVLFIGMEKKQVEDSQLITTEKVFQDFTYYNYKYPQKTSDWLNYREKLDQFVELVEELGILKDIEFVIYYDSPSISPFLLKLIKLCKENNIKIVADVVDWLTVSTNNKLFDIGKNINNWIIKSKVNLKVDGVISISQFLNDYYLSRNIKTIIIPPVMTKFINKETMDKKRFVKEEIKTLIYAGVPFRVGEKNISIESLKDRIDIIFLHLLQSKKNGQRFIFKVYGFEEKDFLLAFPNYKRVISQLDESVRFYGRLPNETIENEIAKADFTILYRDSNRASNAGFPTKVSESLSNGTPVITNDTSDLKKYIQNRRNGFIIDVNKHDSLDKIFELTKEEVWEMKKNCLQYNDFYYKNYKIKLVDFLNEI